MQHSGITISTLQKQSHARQNLIRLMQRINYGEIRHLSIRKGEPVLAPAPVVIRTVKFGGDNSPRSEAIQEDFVLKAEILNFLNEIEEISDGEFESIKIQAGLPSIGLIHG